MVASRDIGIVADDLTGACDVAASFSKKTGSVDVSVSLDTMSATDRGMRVINTQSRLKSPDESRALLFRVGKILKGKSVLFKKIDTALRGPVGAELKGLLDALGPRDIFVAPAIPDIGRITKNGIQYDRGVPINETDYAYDPVSPVRGANIRDVICQTGKVDCSVFDAEDEEELKKIVQMGLDRPDIIFVGSIGLADALADRLEETVFERSGIPHAKRTLIVCGSKYKKSIIHS